MADSVYSERENECQIRIEYSAPQHVLLYKCALFLCFVQDSMLLKRRGDGYRLTKQPKNAIVSRCSPAR